MCIRYTRHRMPPRGKSMKPSAWMAGCLVVIEKKCLKHTQQKLPRNGAWPSPSPSALMNKWSGLPFKLAVVVCNHYASGWLLRYLWWETLDEHGSLFFITHTHKQGYIVQNKTPDMQRGWNHEFKRRLFLRKNKAMDNMHFSEETNIPKACCVCKPKESCTVVHIVILFISKREDHCFNKEVGIQIEVVMARFLFMDGN